MNDIVETTRRYERWLGERVPLVRADLRAKHEKMAESRFAFLRATYYRWAALWPARCPDLARGPSVLAVGDLHVENFSTWRDAEARLVWGVNDVDEAHEAAWSHDLVRLTASAILAREDGALGLAPRAVRDTGPRGERPLLIHAGQSSTVDNDEDNFCPPVVFAASEVSKVTG